MAGLLDQERVRTRNTAPLSNPPPIASDSLKSRLPDSRKPIPSVQKKMADSLRGKPSAIAWVERIHNIQILLFKHMRQFSEACEEEFEREDNHVE